MTAIASKVADLIAKLPDADKPGKESTLTGPAWDAVRPIVEAILAEGKDGIAALIDLITDGFGGGEQGYRPGYALRSITLHVGAPGKDAERKLFVEALASKLRGDRPKDAQAFVIRELELVGGPEAAAALGRLLGDDALCAPAAQALTAIGASAELLDAWGSAQGKRRTAIAQALGSLRIASAAAPLRAALSDEDRDLRLTAAWALARIGDAASAGSLLHLTGAAAGWERGQAVKACLLLGETLLLAGKQEEAKSLYTSLRDFRQDDADAYVREAAERGLAA